MKKYLFYFNSLVRQETWKQRNTQIIISKYENKFYYKRKEKIGKKKIFYIK